MISVECVTCSPYSNVYKRTHVFSYIIAMNKNRLRRILMMLIYYKHNEIVINF